MKKNKCNIVPTEVEDVLNYKIMIPECTLCFDGKCAILGYCFKSPIEDEKLKEDIYSNLQKMLFSSKSLKSENDDYYIDDYSIITNVTITNNIYVPVGGITNEGE